MNNTRELRPQQLEHLSENDQHHEVSANENLVARSNRRYPFLLSLSVLLRTLNLGVLLHFLDLSL